MKPIAHIPSNTSQRTDSDFAKATRAASRNAGLRFLINGILAYAIDVPCGNADVNSVGKFFDNSFWRSVAPIVIPHT